MRRLKVDEAGQVCGAPRRGGGTCERVIRDEACPYHGTRPRGPIAKWSQQDMIDASVAASAASNAYVENETASVLAEASNTAVANY